MKRKVAIIGGGPVGLFLGIKLGLRGVDVDLFEKSQWPVDKACGQGIMPSGVEKLSKIGIDLDISNSCSFNHIHYFDKDKSLKGDLSQAAMGVERKVLSRKLYERAKEITNLNLIPSSNITNLNELKTKYDYYFVCDGLNSKVRESLNFTRTTNNTRMGARMHFDLKPWSNSVEVFWNHNLEAYITPVSNKKIEVAFLYKSEKLGRGPYPFKRLMKFFPELQSKLDMEKSCDDFRAYGPFNKRARGIKKDNIFFLGDAYCFLDGITGEGISLGFSAADIISQSFENFGFRQKFKIKQLYFNYALWVKLALFMSSKPRTRGVMINSLSRFKGIFNLILRLNDKH